MDLKSAYHHLRMHPDDYDLLGFELKDKEGAPIWYAFVVLPFGLGPAAHILTRLTKPVIAKLRSNGNRCCIFIDDGISMADSYKAAVNAAKEFKDILQKAGFVIATEKSMQPNEASQVVQFLGMIINSQEWSIKASDRKIEKAKKLLTQAIVWKTNTVRNWAKVCLLYTSDAADE